jgi:hypothetical protein
MVTLHATNIVKSDIDFTLHVICVILQKIYINN